jgi:hypothetical protein
MSASFRVDAARTPAAEDSEDKGEALVASEE